MSVEVTELSKEQLDAALFDAPADYKQVSSYAEVMGMTLGSRDAMIDPSSFLEEMGINTEGGPGGSTIEPKKVGAIRIGVTSLENKTDARFLPLGLRDKLIGALNGVPGYSTPGDVISGGGSSTASTTLGQATIRRRCLNSLAGTWVRESPAVSLQSCFRTWCRLSVPPIKSLRLSG